MFFRALKSLKIIIIALFCILICGNLPAFAETDETSQSMSKLLKDKSPVAQKLYMWLNVTLDKGSYQTPLLIDFILNSPEWPSLHKFRDKIEKNIEGNVQPLGVELWFKQYPPKTYNGFEQYVTALNTNNKSAQVKDVVSNYFADAYLSKKDNDTMMLKYKSYLTSDVINTRLDNLLWQKRYFEAGYMFPNLNESQQRIARARIALGRMTNLTDYLVGLLKSDEKTTEGIAYDRMKWRRKKDKTDGAIEMLAHQPKDSKYRELWWGERNILSRRKIEDKNYSAAYEIVSNHKLDTKDEEYSQAEWLSGWLALNYLNNPSKAYTHFENFYNSVNSAISRARAAYWLGRTDEAMNNTKSAKNWYSLASQFPSTFYGQLAAEKTGQTFTKDSFMNDTVSPDDDEDFNHNELVSAIRKLKKYGLEKHAENFFIKLFQKADTREKYILIAKLAKEVGLTKYEVEANKRLQQNLGTFMFELGYPILNNIPDKKADKSLIHAITYRESMFNPEAISHAGARGLMQLMPATAKMVSKGAKLYYSRRNLTKDPEYNIRLGTIYLNQLVKKYDGFYPLAIAAYNAGTNNVAKWINKFGDPRKSEIDLINWIELVPIYETRNYIQRVMETYYLYNLKFEAEPKTVNNFSVNQ